MEIIAPVEKKCGHKGLCLYDTRKPAVIKRVVEAYYTEKSLL